MPKPVQFTRGNKFGEREGDYDPEEWKRRDPNVSELASGSDKSRIPGQGGFSPEGPVGDLDAVPAESSQKKATWMLEQELDTLEKSLAQVDPQDLDLSWGAIETEAFERAARQQKVAKKLGKEVKPVETKSVAPEFKDVTIRQYYEAQISEKVSQIEVEKALMGDTYELQALKESTSRGYANIGEALDEVDLELATGDVSDIQSTAKNAPSIANPQQVHTNIGFRGEVHSITQGPEGPVRNPINRPSQVTRADTAETPLKPGETGWTGLEPEGYSPMNPTVQRTGETWEEARRRNAAEARKAAVTKKASVKTVVPDDPALEIEAAKDSDNLKLSRDPYGGYDPTSDFSWAYDVHEHYPTAGPDDWIMPKNPSSTPTAKEIPTTDVGGVDVNDINYQKALKKALASGLDAVTSAAIASKAFQAGKAGFKSIGKKLPMLGLGLITEDMLKNAGVYKKDWSS